MRRTLASTLLALVCSAANVNAADPPSAKKPDAKPAATAKPDVAKPKTAETKTVETKTVERKTQAPTKVTPDDDTLKPSDTAKPSDTDKPAAKKPDAKKPDAKKPEARKPETQKPEKPLTPGGLYRAGDMSRPRPAVITPGQYLGIVPPPSDAVVLFDGNDLAKWDADGVPASRKPELSLRIGGGQVIRENAPQKPTTPAPTKPAAPAKTTAPTKQPELAKPAEPPKHLSGDKKPEPTEKSKPVGGTSISFEARIELVEQDALKPQWKIIDGYMEIPQPRTRGIVTQDEFGSCQIHIEWATPSEVKGTSQGRGNSGIMLHGLGEVQVLDSYQNDTYPDGQAAAIYSKYPPLVNASRKPGEWQTYDIVVELAEVDPKTNQVKRPCRITVMHNGVIAQHASEIDSRATKFKLGLQDHGNPVRYRNIWIRPLKPNPVAHEEKKPEPQKKP